METSCVVNRESGNGIRGNLVLFHHDLRFTIHDLCACAKHTLLFIWAGTETCQHLCEFSRILFHRHVPATSKDHQARVLYQLKKQATMCERNLQVVFAPDEQGRLPY